MKAHAASEQCLIFYNGEKCTPDILTPYLDGIVSKLLILLQVSGSLSQVRSIAEEIKLVITTSSVRKQERAERVRTEDFDAEEA
ncbi:importin [Salix suchowensis]|nr:importin [Salix suchowensis]